MAEEKQAPAEETAEKNGPTITEALGIEDGWMNSMDEQISQEFDKHDLLSDLIDHTGTSITGKELTLEEKKLLFAGFMVAQELNVRKMAFAKMQAMEALMSKLAGGGEGVPFPFPMGQSGEA